jgi:hypothetical protein
MGCDIHCFAEKYRWGKWVKIGEVFDNPFHDPTFPRSSWNSRKTAQPYSERNYYMFSILANVRNDWGIIPIAMPKGFPVDVSSDVWNYSNDKYGRDGHSHSWLTVDELLAYDWYRTITIDRVPMTYRDLASPNILFYNLRKVGQKKVRIVFFFDC